MTVEDSLSPVETLQSTHSKERKELRSKIAAAKRGIAATDKKRKKEVAAQAEAWEKELNDRHARELADALSTATANVKIVEDVVPTPAGEANEEEEAGEQTQKVTRKQKRQDKKAKDVQRRQDAALRDQEAALTSRATQERTAIETLLAERSLSSVEIPPDGDCLFNAVAHQLGVHGLQKATGEEVRLAAANYIREHHDDFLPYLMSESGDLLDDEGFEAYCNRIATPSASGGDWGGDAELRAISAAFGHPIEVLQYSGLSIVFGEDLKSQKLTVTYHKHAYALGEHYNSTIAPLL